MTNCAGDTLRYDVENRLTQVVTGGGVTTDYVYNGDGVRVKKVAGGISTFYVGESYVVSVNGQVTTASKYYSFGGLRVAVKFGSTLYYLHVDHLGSTSVATDASGNPISKQTYLAFGAVRTSEGTSPTDYGFTGQRYDASSALMYYGARYYDPVLGRFTQADPILADAWNPQALNRYGYVYNNPVRYSDPSGHRVEEGCGCYIPPDPAPLPARYEDPSKYGEPPEPEVPPLPVEKCQRACKDDSGPSQPKETPTPSPLPPLPPSDEALPKVNSDILHGPWTLTIGVGGFLEAGLGGQADLGVINLDSSGNLEILSFEPGVRLATAIGGGGDVFIQVTNATSVDNLQAWGANAGMSAPYASVDYVFGREHSYEGIRIGVGLIGALTPPEIPADLHAGVVYNWFLGPRRKLW